MNIRYILRFKFQIVHSNLSIIFEIPWVLFEKSLSLYFDWPKSWIWRTLEQVMNIFCIWHFHNASKELFWQKKNWISCPGSKVPFWQFFHSAKMALLNPCMKLKFFFGQMTSFEALWKCHMQKIFITCSRVHQIQDLGQSELKTEIF